MTSLPFHRKSDRADRERAGSWAGRLARFPLWVVLLAATAWAAGALWHDFPSKEWSHGIAIGYGAVMLGLLLYLDGPWKKLTALALGFVAVLAWWLSLLPSNLRNWQMDVERVPWAEFQGSRVFLHNARNCTYQSETSYQPGWQTRIVDLDELTGMDVAITYWGSQLMAHPIISFQFGDRPPVCFSIETRKEVGESYSAIGGFYRQYELIYVCADERDVIRLRTNFRKGEDVYLYRMNATPAAARERFMEYVTVMNELRTRPRWYNAATTNCTTAIRAQRATAKRAPFDWRMLVNGYMDEMLYEHGALKGGLPFAELKAKARINEAARAANDAPDFWRKIRAGRPGFDAPATP